MLPSQDLLALAETCVETEQYFINSPAFLQRRIKKIRWRRILIDSSISALVDSIVGQGNELLLELAKCMFRFEIQCRNSAYYRSFKFQMRNAILQQSLLFKFGNLQRTRFLYQHSSQFWPESACQQYPPLDFMFANQEVVPGLLTFYFENLRFRKNNRSWYKLPKCKKNCLIHNYTTIGNLVEDCGGEEKVEIYKILPTEIRFQNFETVQDSMENDESSQL